MSSKIEICNMALMNFKGRFVTDIDNPTTNEEKICAVIFDQTAREVIMEGTWSSCKTRAALVELDETPAFGYYNTFQLPSDVLKIVRAEDAYGQEISYVKELDKVLTDSTVVNITYLKDNLETDTWDTVLTRAVVQALKAKLANPLSGEIGKIQLANQEYQISVLDGLSIDGQQGSAPSYDLNSELINVRDE